jgi:DNA ligase 1
MKFSEFALYLDKLEATSSRLSLIDILSELFKKTTSEEVRQICYLVQGRVVPFFEPTELGMAENMVAVAVGQAFKTTKENVITSYRKLGNMGLAAKELSETSGLKPKELTIDEVYDRLLSIAKTTGVGSVEKKIGILSDLLDELDPISVKHVVNIPLGTLRLGIGDPTVMDALSVSKTGDKKMRPAIEDAYNKTSDLGEIAKTFFEEGEVGLEKIKIIVGKPVRPALAERTPNADEAVKRLGSEFGGEPKFDGFRVAIHKNGDEIKLFSRNLENTTNSFPDLVLVAQKEVKAKSAILEGEAIAYNPETEEFLPFQETSKRRRKHGIEDMAKKLPLVVFAFDLLYLNGEDITHLPYKERRKYLSTILPEENSIIKISEERVLHNSKEVLEFFNEAIERGLEGLMLKKLDASYKAGGRGFHWIKFKRSQAGKLDDTVDCVLLGVYTGRGKRTEFGVGGLLVGVYNKKKDVFESISRIGTGLKDEDFRKLNEIGGELKVDHKPPRVVSLVTPSYWVTPKLVLEIYADEITRSPIHTAGTDLNEDGLGYALRFPRVVRFRESDKKPEDATTTEEVKKLYSLQYKQGKK